MKKLPSTIIGIIMGFLLALLQPGCVSGLSSDTSIEIPKTVYANYTQDGFELEIPLRGNRSSLYQVAFTPTNLTLEGCNTEAVSFTPTDIVFTDSVSIITLQAQGQAPLCQATRFTLTGQAEITSSLDGKTRTERIVLQSNMQVLSKKQYNINATSETIDITQGDQLYTIAAYVTDENGLGVSGVEVAIKPITQEQFGSIEGALIAKTDDNGKAKFSYRSPVDLSRIKGQEFTLEISVASNGAIKTTTLLRFVANFDAQAQPLVQAINKQIDVASNSQKITMRLRVLEQNKAIPYTTGSVNVVLPSVSLEGIDVGSFDTYNAGIDLNGYAEFIYTAPADIQTLLDRNITSLEFKFYHSSNTVEYETIEVRFALSNTNTSTNYAIETATDTGAFELGLGEKLTLSLKLVDSDGNAVAPESIDRITLTSEIPSVGKLAKLTSNTEETSLVFTQNEILYETKVNIVSNSLSGYLTIKAKYEFRDNLGEQRTMEKNINFIVLSGPPTAISITYTGVSHDPIRAKYIEQFALSVTDAYNNQVNTQPIISVGAIVEYAVDGSSATGVRTTTSPRLWYGRNDMHGTLTSQNGKAVFQTSSPTTFRWVDAGGSDIQNDRLVIFGSGYVYGASGKWDIESVSGGTLYLKDEYKGGTYDGLYFAVGHNSRQDLCDQSGREYIGNMRSSSIRLDATGSATLEFEYDYHLTGKDIMIWVNLEGFDADNNTVARIGESIKHTLRGNGLRPEPKSYTVKAGTGGVAKFDIHHENVAEWYQNAHFGYDILDTTCGYIYLGSSNDFDARECQTLTTVDHDANASTPPITVGNTNGTAWVAFYVYAGQEDCTFSIDKIRVSDEF